MKKVNYAYFIKAAAKKFIYAIYGTKNGVVYFLA